MKSSNASRLAKLKSSNGSRQADSAEEGLADGEATTDGEVKYDYKYGKKEKKKTTRKRIRTHLGPRIKVLRFVDNAENKESKKKQYGVKKIECQMNISKDPSIIGSEERSSFFSFFQRTVTLEFEMETFKKTVSFEFPTTDMGPEEMANTFISEDLLAEKHKQIFVDQLVEIARQLRKDPATLPQLTFLPCRPQSCGCCTRGRRRRQRNRIKSILINLFPSSLQRILGQVTPLPRSCNSTSQDEEGVEELIFGPVD